MSIKEVIYARSMYDAFHAVFSLTKVYWFRNMLRAETPPCLYFVKIMYPAIRLLSMELTSDRKYQ